MKILISLALVVMAGATFNLALADKKKKKEAKPAAVAVVRTLNTGADSLSYAAGRYVTQGLERYLQQEYQVDTAYMHDVLTGFDYAASRQSDPQYRAYNAGCQLARMLFARIVPTLQDEFAASKDSINLDLLAAGFRDALAGDTTLMAGHAAFNYFEARVRADREAAEAQYKTANEKWLADNKTREGVKTTASGLQYKVVKQGTGAIPNKDDKVEVKYEGKLIDGTVFDSSYKRNPSTVELGVNQVIKGWTEALCMMPVGSEWELYIPAGLAYGAHANGPIKGNSTLIFSLQLVGIKDKAQVKDNK